MASRPQFVTRVGAFLLFLVLEAIAFYLIINFNSTQQEIAAETYSLYANRVMRTYAGLTRYANLNDRVRELQAENERLLARLPNAQYQDSLHSDSVHDAAFRQRYVFLSANIINKSPLNPRNTMIIDRGHIHGVEKFQGVITDQGIVGIVIAVASQHARVMSAWHQDFRLSAGIRRKQVFGSLVWEGGDTRYMKLLAIPEYAAVTIGDTVETTGYSQVFPAGIPIGIVDNIDIKPGDNNYDLNIRLFQNIYSLKHGYVVRDLKKEDLDQLNQ